MAETEAFLAFDLGATSGRAVMGRFDGNSIKTEEVHRFPNGPVELRGRLFWDILGLFREVRTGLGLAARADSPPVAAGIDTWGVDFGLLDEDGELIGNPYCYRDPGVEGMMDATFRKVPRAEVFQRTGLQFMAFNSLYRLMAIARRSPHRLEQARTLMMIPDLLNYWLTGRAVCEFTNATTTQFYNPTLGRWDKDLLARLDVPSHFLPEIVQPGDLVGSLLAPIADEAWLPRIPVVAPACHDTGSAVVAVPLSGPGAAYISCGTWALVGTELPETNLTPDALACNFTNEGGVSGTWRFLKNVSGLWLLEECRREWQQQGEDVTYDALLHATLQSTPFRSLIDPDHPGFVAPHDKPARIVDRCLKTGQPKPATQGETVRCILESLALKFRYVIGQIESVTGRSMQVIHMVGGGSRNRLLCEWTAAACGKPVLAGPAEATALGNLLVQAMARGRLASLQDIRSVVRNSVEVETYEPTGESGWEAAYARLLSVMKER